MPGNPTFKKREKERSRQERQREKDAKRRQRREERKARANGIGGDGIEAAERTSVDENRAAPGSAEGVAGT